MKIKKRNTHKRVVSGRITSPETRKNPATNEVELLLSYADSSFNHCHSPTGRELFLYAAGNNEEGELPDGLDRLAHHKFVIHLDADGVAIGLDVVPSRVYRSSVIPASQKDVGTVKLHWSLNGAVCRITQRPAGTTATQLIQLIAELDELAASGTNITETTRLKSSGKIVSASGDSLEIKLRSNKSAAPAQIYDPEAG